jgi:hypothetical protein
MILTSTRFRRPSRLACQPFRLALKDPLPGAKGSGEQRETFEPAMRQPVTATTAAALGAPCRFSCASAKLAYGKSLSRRSVQASSPVRLCPRSLDRLPLDRRRR